ncbi:LytR family transcriptional regulator [Tessaracoccus rhinocerotis]|uniref:LytR family transcriptional regulator n=1 Tax=Tessaracoccus rhinocerotis TaxID=1689449 RepID=A0A553JZB4_9ACTN|nr:LCP family protein [Tessaracoccus rhinocerotis]TRY17808.1 LytR family transcriptional regulator [Tessaracoccus rhinocerotis]
MNDEPKPSRPRRALPPSDEALSSGVGDLYGPVFRPAASPQPPRAQRSAPEPEPEPRPTPKPTPRVDDAPTVVRAPHPAKEPSLRRSIALTALSTVLPGAGLLGARSGTAKVVGAVVPLAFLGTIAAIGWSAFSNLGNFAGFAVDPAQLRRISLVLVAIGLVWVALIAGTHLLTRPKGLGPSKRTTGAVAVTVLSLVISAPVAVAARYSFDQQKLVETVFADEAEVTSSSRPTIAVEEDNPWEGHPRLNILLLGADGAKARSDENGIRTDTIMVASINTSTGATDIVQIPRNLQYAPFPEGSELAELFPDGFRGEGDPAEWFINALWHTVEDSPWYSEVLQGQTYRGAEALKQGVEGITGLKVDYFVLLDIDGVQRLINAMGGVTVNINDRLPIGGDSSGRRPTGYLEPGPDQHLNGYEAMWYARSRLESSDYDRMARQSCLVNAIIKQANPATMLTSYEAIAAAGADMVMTDIPQQVLQPLVELSLVVKDAEIERLVFAPGKNGYDYANPDFETMRESVEEAISDDEPSQAPSTPASTAEASPSDEPTQSEEPGQSESPTAQPTFVDGSQSVSDACAYNPK